jgi:hypothetical protein
MRALHKRLHFFVTSSFASAIFDLRNILSMTLQEFKKTLQSSEPPPSLKPLLKALWYEGKNDWEKAHNIAQDIASTDGSWVHAYLHRKEGDKGNASYWYHRAGKPFPQISLEEEWESLVEQFLKSSM